MTTSIPARSGVALVAAVAVLLTAAAGCDNGKSKGSAAPSIAATRASSFVRAEFDHQIAERQARPDGDPATPWVQAIAPEWVDTTRFARTGNWHLCLSGAGLDDPWSATGLTTMKAEAGLNPRIASLTVDDAGNRTDKQVSDLSDLRAKGCDALIVLPAATAALAPAVARVCQSGIPVVVFYRPVKSTCPVTFVHAIGGYAFGATAAEFIAGKMKPAGRLLALRSLPGVDVLESRWAGAKEIFGRKGVKVIGTEFTNGDAARTRTIVGDYLRRGRIDGVWMDAGTTGVAAVAAFEDAGVAVPPINGDDQQDFLQLWQQKKFVAVSPTYPVYMWRTALIAATEILSGQRVPHEWVLPQPIITVENLTRYVRPGMPPQFHPTCGCQQMPGFPQTWGGR